MAQQPFVDLSEIDFEKTAIEETRVRSLLPQRHEFAMVDRVVHVDHERQVAVATKRLSEDDWWCRGHFPGNPILPGILMIEGAAQVGSILWKLLADLPDDHLIGFGGVESLRFRGQVVPPNELVYVASGGRFRSRLAQLPMQVFAQGKLVCEATIIGASI